MGNIRKSLEKNIWGGEGGIMESEQYACILDSQVKSHTGGWAGLPNTLRVRGEGLHRENERTLENGVNKDMPHSSISDLYMYFSLLRSRDKFRSQLLSGDYMDKLSWFSWLQGFPPASGISIMKLTLNTDWAVLRRTTWTVIDLIDLGVILAHFRPCVICLFNGCAWEKYGGNSKKASPSPNDPQMV